VKEKTSYLLTFVLVPKLCKGGYSTLRNLNENGAADNRERGDWFTGINTLAILLLTAKSHAESIANTLQY